jgi:hypothetical protein
MKLPGVATVALCLVACDSSWDTPAPDTTRVDEGRGHRAVGCWTLEMDRTVKGVLDAVPLTVRLQPSDWESSTLGAGLYSVAIVTPEAHRIRLAWWMPYEEGGAIWMVLSSGFEGGRFRFAAGDSAMQGRCSILMTTGI